MSRGRKFNPRGRTKSRDNFVKLDHWIFESRAYRSLKPGPRALLWEFIRRFNGHNNGNIVFSQREMSERLNVVDRETVANYVRELEAKGFIKVAWRGGFNMKVRDRRASEWALTWLHLGEVRPTKEFMSWRPPIIDETEKPETRDGKSALTIGSPSATA